MKGAEVGQAAAGWRVALAEWNMQEPANSASSTNASMRRQVGSRGACCCCTASQQCKSRRIESICISETRSLGIMTGKIRCMG